MSRGAKTEQLFGELLFKTLEKFSRGLDVVRSHRGKNGELGLSSVQFCHGLSQL